MADNLEAFNQLNCLPWNLKLSRLDDGQGLEATFRQHEAKWHDSCRLKYNSTKLRRAEKKKAPRGDDGAEKKAYEDAGAEKKVPHGDEGAEQKKAPLEDEVTRKFRHYTSETRHCSKCTFFCNAPRE